MPGLWERDDLAGNVHTLFRLTAADGAGVDLELVSVSQLSETESMRSFSALFVAPVERPFRQGMFRLEHETLGTAELFIVPVGRNGKGFEYEAVFTYLAEGS